MTIGTSITDRDLLDLIQEAVSRKNLTLTRFPSALDAVDAGPEVVLAEWPMTSSTEDILSGLQRARQKTLPVIVFLPRGIPELLRRAVEAGAFDVLLMPVDSAEIDAELDELTGAAAGLPGAKRLVFEKLRESDLIGDSPPFRRCLIELQQAAACDANILLLGATGTGKEIFARAIHSLCPRASEPFLAVNCASFPDALLESELFGHVKGAFTGADHTRKGRFAAVRAGTLLLDEIGDIRPALQTKLLRVIETRQYQVVGDNEAVRFDGRLIAATSMDLDEAITDGRFRPDLMGRLDQFRIRLPALRERPEDIPLLARHFLIKHSMGRGVDISASVMDLLQGYDFPMNVRQLENIIVGALARSFQGPLILPKHLPPELLLGSSAKDSEGSIRINISETLAYEDARNAALEAVDREYLSRLLRLNEGNQSAAAEAAGIDRKTFAARWKNAQKASS